MVSLHLKLPATEKDAVIATLWEAGTAGVTESDLPSNECALQAFFESPIDDSGFANYSPRWEEEPDIDWAAETRAAWPARTVGLRWFIVPPWNEDAVPANRIRLVINPGIGFGTGNDLTTQLCLEALECEWRLGDTVLDFGTGSGILALAASALGAKKVVACDIDDEAVRAARLDLPGNIGLFTGSIRSVRDASIDLLLANLNAETIANHAAEMRRVLRPGGRVIISGVPPRHRDRVSKALSANGLPPREVYEEQIWLRIVC